MPMNPTILAVTQRVRERSARFRTAYLARMEAARGAGTRRATLACANLAHAFAASGEDKVELRAARWPNIAIVSAYNDMLSAHQPLERYPALIKQAARQAGAVAQFAGGVPAMCDGVTQGEPGMEMSLFSRDVIAMATAVALSHNVFDAALCLGVCDKIVPGLLIGALSFGHLPFIFVPGGPMSSGSPNSEKAKVRQLFAQGKVGRVELLESEASAYHGPGTCTFYGTANTNQMLMEIMGLHLPGSAFIHPLTPLRDALTGEAARRVAALTQARGEYTPLHAILDERAVINAIIGLHATGGSTNHTIHLVAIARAAGIHIDWSDFAELSEVIPLLARVYPNGAADINQFHAAGGMSFVIGELLDAGLLHGDVNTVAGPGLHRYVQEPWLDDGALRWRTPPRQDLDRSILRRAGDAFSEHGGLTLLEGNLGRAVMKVSAVAPQHRVVEAPARVFESQYALQDAFQRGELTGDFVAVVRFQGPRANGMPELHGLTPVLATLMDRGQRVALVTDGRMSGASGRIPAAIHVTPEALAGGELARLRDGDVIRVDGDAGRLEARVPAEEWARRRPAPHDPAESQWGLGRELFAGARRLATGPEQGAMIFGEATAEPATRDHRILRTA